MLILPKVTIEPLNVRKIKIKEPSNVIKVKLHLRLALHNVRIELSNVRKKIREPPNLTKVLSNVMLVLSNVTMEPSNMRKKNKGTIKCDKRKVTCDVGIAQYKEETFKCEKK